ncbi:MAG: acetolactate synthase large subunit [Acidimicrobiia bacterium]|nr:acetolactate synthase large subunit [Acidimicrobiia bacterium]
MKLTGAQALVKSLEMENVDVVFGLPGGAILPVYDPILESPIRHILVRHEQGAGHMAEGYAHATGKPGVAMVTSGPGATNIVTPLADAMMDSIPMVVITGQVPLSVIGTDAFQECDTVGITMGVTKHNWLITDAKDIPRIVQEAFHVATTGRPGPVLIDLPKDIANAEMEWYWPENVNLPGYKPTTKGHPKQIKDAAKLIAKSKKPVIYAGGGILKARAADALKEFAELIGAPVVTTLMARGCFPDEHELCLGMPGMHGNFTAITAMQESDLLITLGARFDDRVTGKLDGFAPEAKIIHVDVDPAELGKVRNADVPIVGDCRLVIEELIKATEKQFGKNEREDISEWIAHIKQNQKDFPLAYDRDDDETVKPQYCIEQIHAAADEDTILVSGVGLHQMYASQYWKFNHPYTWINSGGLGTMGFSIPAAIGAKVAKPDRMVWAVDGDGCFQMTAQELVTAAIEKIPVKIAILNNSYLGMVRQWQELFYEERYSEVYLSDTIPDFVMWATAMGCAAFRVDKKEDVITTIEKANAINDRPVVIDFRIDQNEKVFPMVPVGRTNSQVELGPMYPPHAGQPDIAGIAGSVPAKSGQKEQEAK